jgi:hypothetical protein
MLSVAKLKVVRIRFDARAIANCGCESGEQPVDKGAV